MRFGSPQLWLGAFSTACVLYLAFANIEERTSPGPLARVHGSDESLADRDGCSQCHGGGSTSMAASCLECHADVGADVDGGRGLHGSLDRNVGQQCALCHSEHHGEEFALVNIRSFAIAGVPQPDDFPHDIVGFSMDGKHLELTCTKCHAHAFDAVPPEGERRFMGLDKDCATCHEDAHEGRLGAGCADCHGQDEFPAIDTFEHASFPQRGLHAEQACRDCHAADEPYALEALLGPRRRPAERTCQDCHNSPHEGAFLRSVGNLVALTSKASCITCHDAGEDDWHSVPDLTAEQHACSGFGIGAPHDQADCADCHSSTKGSFAERYPGRAADSCESCHSDAHTGYFDELLSAADTEHTCVTCHERDSFHDVTEERFDHGQWTGFPIAGAHRQTHCESCHPRAEEPDEHGRTLGVAAEHFGEIRGCETCHEDPHISDFTGPGKPRRYRGEEGCARCHTDTSFRALPDHFDHRLWTGFALQGGHAKRKCAECHTPLPVPDEHGRTWERAPGTSCGDCHEDVHARQFDERGKTDCSRCHASADSFSDITFNHRRDTRFPLGVAHVGLECSACHTPTTSPSGGEFVRYKPLGTKCTDCHGDSGGRLPKKKKEGRR